MISDHSPYDKYAALEVYLESTELDMAVNLLGLPYGTVHWDTQNFTISNCLHFGQNNDIVPEHKVWYRCPDCLMITPDAVGHINPCPPRNTFSAPRENLLSLPMALIFKIKTSSAMKILNDGRFMDASPGLQLTNDIVEALFSFHTLSCGSTMMTCEASSIKRFSIVFAVFHRNAWRLRLRLIVTLKTGIIGFKLTKTLYVDNERVMIPPEYQTNTVLIFGLHSRAENIAFDLRAYANSTGSQFINENGQFQGSSVHVIWNRNSDTVEIPNDILGPNATAKWFEKSLYRANGVQNRIAPLYQLRFTVEPTQCHLFQPLTMIQKLRLF